MLLIPQDFSWAGISLALALVFNPFPDKPFPELSLGQKFIIVVQMLTAIFFIGIAFFQTVQN
jgi:hypothetical protein